MAAEQVEAVQTDGAGAEEMVADTVYGLFRPAPSAAVVPAADVCAKASHRFAGSGTG